MKKLLLWFILICGLMLLLFACRSSRQATAAPAALNGSWELIYILDPPSTFHGLYPTAKKPILNFDTNAGTLSGNTSCNSLSGKLNTDGNKIDFNGPIIMTKMFCPGDGEPAFMNVLKRVDRYDINKKEGTMTFFAGDETVMKFTRKK
ncbi:META domain-containing protein [Sediminibacterium ginsengisoli]|uniref:Heat shock protein HslJ n=1 Tax=Sediminibacterium ginsengisoli TaxID=413434 RepID=A0A1T4RG39_9BACT|nr:META domain-containing protein [Sediminibacterium ginsengisoli]SKA14974.1 Heat shock protein HslJ [Sediminibacterium ginsengisoli]